MKATPEEYAFHCRMLDPDDPVAFAALAEWLYDDLVRETGRRAGGGADPVLVEEAVGQALLSYNDAPERYDPERAPLRGYLVMAAYGDYRNAVAKEARRTSGRVSLSDETDTEQDLADDRQNIEAVLDRIEAEALWEAVAAAFPDPTDRQIVTLLINRVRSYEPYSKVLGLTNLPDDEQRKQVKRAKDRIAKRLRRIGQKLDG